jgi:hypothetical protein
LAAEWQHVTVPILFTLLPLFLGHWILKKIHLSLQFKWLPLLVLIYLIYNPVRTAITGNTWGRQPSTRELAGMNMYLSLSYFMGRILPAKIQKETLPLG